MTPLSRPRLQVVQSEEIAQAISTIRKHRPGLINDSMVVTSSLVEHALALESDNSQQANYQTPYGMTILSAGSASHQVGLFRFLTQNLDSIAAIFAHIDNNVDTFLDYVSRGEKPAYTFVLKGKGFTDFEFLHIATGGSSFEECLTLLVLDFTHHRDDIRFNVINTASFEQRLRHKSARNYVPSLDEMARAFFNDEVYVFGGGGGVTSSALDLGWKANTAPYEGLDIRDTRYVDYSRALTGLKPSSLETKKYGVEVLVRSGVLGIDRKNLDLRYRCLCDGWTEEQRVIDLYELGRIFGQHFGYEAAFSPSRFLHAIAACVDENHLNAFVYLEKGKRIEVLPMKWNQSWFTYRSEGKENYEGDWCLLHDDPNPFRLYDMKDFFPDDLEEYKQKKKNPKQ